MRSVNNVVANYDESNPTDRKKIVIVEWFQKHPGSRFDKSEIHAELADSLEVGQSRTGQILKDLVEESVLESYGDQRKAYKLADDLIVPIRYQVSAGLEHLRTIVDVKRWGIAGLLAMCTVIWLLLTLPFWFFSILLLISPNNSIGPFSKSEVLVFAAAMSIWLLVFVVLTYSLQYIHRWWKNSDLFN